MSRFSTTVIPKLIGGCVVPRKVGAALPSVGTL